MSNIDIYQLIADRCTYAIVSSDLSTSKKKKTNPNIKRLVNLLQNKSNQNHRFLLQIHRFSHLHLFLTSNIVLVKLDKVRRYGRKKLAFG